MPERVVGESGADTPIASAVPPFAATKSIGSRTTVWGVMDSRSALGSTTRCAANATSARSPTEPWSATRQPGSPRNARGPARRDRQRLPAPIQSGGRPVRNRPGHALERHGSVSDRPLRARDRVPTRPRPLPGRGYRRGLRACSRRRRPRCPATPRAPVQPARAPRSRFAFAPGNATASLIRLRHQAPPQKGLVP